MAEAPALVSGGPSPADGPECAPGQETSGGASGTERIGDRGAGEARMRHWPVSVPAGSRDPAAPRGRAPREGTAAFVAAGVLHLGAALVVARLVAPPADTVSIPLSFHVTIGALQTPPRVSERQPSPPPETARPGERSEPVPALPRRGAIVPRLSEGHTVRETPTAVLAPRGSGRAALAAPAEVEISEGAITGNFEFGYYLTAVRGAIRRVWSPPRGAAVGRTLDALVRFSIRRDGQMGESSVEASSGLRYFDQAALAAVRAAAPFPPLPRAYSYDELVVHFGFHYAE